MHFVLLPDIYRMQLFKTPLWVKEEFNSQKKIILRLCESEIKYFKTNVEQKLKEDVTIDRDVQKYARKVILMHEVNCAPREPLCHSI